MSEGQMESRPRSSAGVEIPADPDLVEGRPHPTSRGRAGERHTRPGDKRSLAIAGSLAMLMFVGWADHVTGPDVPMGIAYVVPVAVVAWYGGVLGGTLAAGLAALMGLAAAASDPAPGNGLYWSATLRFAVLILVAIVVDIAHHRYVKARLRAQASTERAQRLAAEQRRYETLFHTVAHDARGPLTTIYGMALTLERTATGISEEERDLLHSVASNAERLDALLTDLLSMDRRHRLTVVGGNSGSIGRLVRRLVSELPALADRQVKIDAGDDACAVDAVIVERMLENLLLNCATHTPSDVRIYVRTWRENGTMVIAVEDDGPGIPREQADEVFLPYRQGSEEGPGHGIGLATVWSFADLYGGLAWVEDRVGGGASFRLRLPASPAPGSPGATDERGSM